MSKKRKLDENNSAEDEFQFVHKCHSSILLAEMDVARKYGRFCDLTIVCENNVKFQCHKCVLTAFCPYFQGMFENECLESKENVIPLKEVTAEAMAFLLDYLYSGNIKITSENCKTVLQVADYFSIVPLINAICQYLESKLNKYNCFEIFNFAELYSLKNTKLKAFEYALRNFSCVTKYADFLKLSVDNLVNLISNDRLEVDREEVVFLAVQKWFKQNPQERLHDLFTILECVRLPLADKYFVYDCAESFPALKQDPRCMKLIEEAKHFHFLPNRYPEIMFTKRTKPRYHSSTMQVIVLLGGSTKKYKHLNSVQCYDPDQNSQFNITTILPDKISGHSAVSSGKNIYVMGGCSPKKVLNKLWKYDVISNNWLKMNPMSIHRSNFGVATVDDDIYVVGGYSNRKSRRSLDSVERYNQSSNTWSFVQKLKTPLEESTVVSYDQKIYVAGGVNSEHPNGVNSLYRYSPETNKWDEVAPMLFPKWGAAGCTLNGFIYIIGGYDSKQVLRYDIKNNFWNEVACMPECRANFGATILDGKIYIIGGVKSKNDYNEDVYCYNPARDLWNYTGRMSNAGELFGCVRMNIQKSNCYLNEPSPKMSTDSLSSLSTDSYLTDSDDSYDYW